MTRLRTPFAILTAALLFTWPALLNRYPLLYPDSVSYLSDGRPTFFALFHHTLVNAMRSEFYSLGIFPFHWNFTPWPIVALQALLTAYVLWLVVASMQSRHHNRPASQLALSQPATRNLQPATIPTYLAITAGLSLLTTASWYVSLIMPDILGALVYLALYLLLFARETLSRAERIALSLIAVWGITAHATHLMLAAGLCALLTLLYLFRWSPLAQRGRELVHIIALVAIATAAQLTLHTWLYGHPSLSGNHPPYLMARIIADGPGAFYLQQNCSHLDWAICAYATHLPHTDDDFLWDPAGVWSTADEPTQQRLLAEEMPLVRATLRAYPRQQLAVSWANFTHQLNDFGVNDFDNNPWMQSNLPGPLPGSESAYARSLQAGSAVPSNAFTTLQRWIVVPSALLLAAILPYLIRHRRNHLLGLLAIIVPTLLANAFLTAVLSSSDARYQARIVWLIPLAATLTFLDYLHRQSTDSCTEPALHSI
jgi:hypothetical protein